MTLKRISKKRSATANLGFNSTFSRTPRKPKEVMTVDQLKASGLLTTGANVKKPKTEKQKWKRLADKWFSEFIRLRDSDEHGYVTCITSGRRLPWRSVDCGHWISRAKEATRYHEMNANAQSKGSNRFQGGHFLEHGLAIDEKFGAGTRDFLEGLARTRCKRTAADYQFIADSYKKRVLHIKAMEPWRYNCSS